MHNLLLAALIAGLAACSNNSDSAGGFDRPSSVSAQVADLTEGPGHVLIYALDPMPVMARREIQDLPADKVFHGHQILASAELPGTEDRRELVALLWKAISVDRGIPVDCFNPRHGIRVRRGDQGYDWVICFECFSTLVYDQEGNLVANHGTSSVVEPGFSSIYRAAGLELAE